MQLHAIDCNMKLFLVVFPIIYEFWHFWTIYVTTLQLMTFSSFQYEDLKYYFHWKNTQIVFGIPLVTILTKTW